VTLKQKRGEASTVSPVIASPVVVWRIEAVSIIYDASSSVVPTRERARLVAGSLRETHAEFAIDGVVARFASRWLDLPCDVQQHRAKRLELRPVLFLLVSSSEEKASRQHQAIGYPGCLRGGLQLRIQQQRQSRRSVALTGALTDDQVL
jgi:hypothetical protein